MIKKSIPYNMKQYFLITVIIHRFGIDIFYRWTNENGIYVEPHQYTFRI